MTARIDRTTPLKFLRDDGASPYAGYAWPLPKGNSPDNWVEVRGKIVVCDNGLHFCTIEHWQEWADDRLFVAEIGKYCKRYTEDEVKFAVRKARLVREVTAYNLPTIRAFIRDCAEHAGVPCGPPQHISQTAQKARHILRDALALGNIPSFEAFNAEAEWQIDRLLAYLNGDITVAP